MTEKELQKEYYENWKKENPQRYLLWIICRVADVIPVVIALFQLNGGMNDEKVTTIVICFVVLIVMELLAAIAISSERKGWKKYLEANKDRLKK